MGNYVLTLFIVLTAESSFGFLSIPSWFTSIFFPLYFSALTFAAFVIVRGGFCWEDLGLNLHLTATNLALSMTKLEHPSHPDLEIPMLLVVALPLFLTFLLYAFSIKGIVGKKGKVACVGLGTGFFTVSLVWALSFFLSMTAN